MSQLAVRVENLSKQYRIGMLINHHPTLGETLNNFLTMPFKRMGQLLRGQAHAATDLNATIWALKDISFEIQQGEVVGIIGRNGAGKSTLLKILSRITEPTEGHAEIHGRLGSLLEVGTGFHPELTGRDNIFLNGAILGMRKAEIARKFDEIVAFSEIEKFLDTPVKHYSSGMYVRLAFAVAAHLDPEILIIDEVLAVGDLSFQKRCLGKMDQVARQGRTVLFVSHNMEAVRKLCNRSILLQEGRVALEGSTESVIENYVDEGLGSQSTFAIPPPAEKAVPGRALELSVEDAAGRSAASIPVGTPWQVRVRFLVERPLKHFVIGLGMRNYMGEPLRACWSDPQVIEPGQYVAVFREEMLWLAPGHYGLVVGLSDQGNTFHYNDNAGFLNIAQYAKGVELVTLEKVGIVLNKMKVAVEKIGEVPEDAGTPD